MAIFYLLTLYIADHELREVDGAEVGRVNQAVALLLLPPVLAAQEISIEAARAWGQNDDITVVTVGRDG